MCSPQSQPALEAELSIFSQWFLWSSSLQYLSASNIHHFISTAPLHGEGKMLSHHTDGKLSQRMIKVKHFANLGCLISDAWDLILFRAIIITLYSLV